MIADADYEKVLDEGIALFNGKKFFECHDKLEEAWKEVKQEPKAMPGADPRRDFLHGLILLSVAYFHWQRKNAVGAIRKFREALTLWKPYPNEMSGVTLAPLRVAANAALSRLERDRDAPFRIEIAPTIKRGPSSVPAPGQAQGGQGQ